MDYSYYQSGGSQPTTTGLSQFSDYDQQLINNAANAVAAAEYVKSATRSLYQQPQQTLLTPPPPQPQQHHLYTSHTNLAAHTGPPTSLASSQYLKLAQPLNSGASTAPPLSILHAAQQQQSQTQHPHHQLSYITYNLDEMKLGPGGSTNVLNQQASGAGGHINPVSNTSQLTNGVYSSLGSLAHSGTRSI
jgi:hypothetical protein